jgi:RES domain
MSLDTDDRICPTCIGDPFLRSEIERDGLDDCCAHCGEDGKTVALHEIAARTIPVLNADYTLGETEFRFHLDDEGDDDHVWEEYQGSTLEEVLADLLECDETVAEAVAAEVRSQGGFRFGESEWADTDEYRFQRLRVSETRHHGVWENFEAGIRHRRRFFGDPSASPLNELLGSLDDLRGASGASPVVILEPGAEKPDRIYRARLLGADWQADATKILLDPWRELGPPNPERVPRISPGRMNPAGIPVFYGAFSHETCIAEIRPSVGNDVVYGEFEVIQPLRLLDLTTFDGQPPAGSPFDPVLRERRERWAFLRDFHARVSRPILPNDVELEYVPTQVVAEFIHHVLGFDGLIFRSAQTSVGESGPRASRNIVLFSVEDLIEVPPTPDAKDARESDPFWSAPSTANAPATNRPALRFVPDSGRVQHVTGVVYTSTVWGSENPVTGSFDPWQPYPPRPAGVPAFDEIEIDF